MRNNFNLFEVLDVSAGKIAFQKLLLFSVTLMLLTISFSSVARPEYVVGLTQQGIRIASVEEVELGFNYELEKISKDKDYALKIKVFSSDVELNNMLQARIIKGYFGSPMMFIENMRDFDASRLFVPVIGNKVKQRYVILVRKDSGVNQLAQLAQKEIAYCTTDEVGALYLQHALKQKGLGTVDGFFSKKIIKKNPSLAATAVFFKETDAAIILESDYLIAAELNPQLLKQMQSIETSPEYLTHLLAFSNEHGFAEKFNIEDTVVQLARAIHRLTLMKNYKYGTMQKVSLEDLKSVQDLVADTRQDKAKLK